MADRIRAAIFDMDGTLLDTMPYWRFTTIEYCLRHAVPVRDEDLISLRYVSSRKMIAGILDREGRTDLDRGAIIPEVEAYMNRHYLYDARIKEGIIEYLEKLRAAGIRMCVSTGSPREYARNGLKRLGLIDYFEFVTDGYEYGVSKHDPKHFDLLAERLGTAAEHCEVYEDALYAMRSAKAAGCRVTAIEDGTAAPDREEIRALADRYITGWQELL